MRKIKIKSPKLKHTALCNFVLFLPIILCFLPMLLTFENDVELSILFLFSAFILILIYLFKNFAFLMLTDITLKMIKSKKKDAEEFRTDKNGKNRSEIEQRLIMRCNAFGKKEFISEKEYMPICLVHKTCSSAQIFYSSINKNIAVFSFESLTKNDFDKALKEARFYLKSIAITKDKLQIFKTKSERNAPVCRADVAIFIADYIDDSIKKDVRKKSVSNDTECFLPCVVDCKNGAYYFDAENDIYELGLMGKPPKNYAISASKKILFNGKPPYKTSTPVRLNRSEDIELWNMSLWDFYKDFNDTDKKEKSDNLKEIRKRLKSLKEGNYEIKDEIIYLKQNGKIITFSILPECDDEKNVLLTVDDIGFVQGKDKYPRKKLLKKIEKNAALHYIANNLEKQGYTVEFTEE